MSNDHLSPDGTKQCDNDETAPGGKSPDGSFSMYVSGSLFDQEHTGDLQYRSSPEPLNIDRDILNERRELYRERAEEEVAIWLEHCKKDPDYWDLFGTILKDERSARIRAGSWRGLPVALNNKDARFHHSSRDESVSTSEEEAPIRPGAATQNITRTATIRQPSRESLRRKADWLRSIMGRPSIQKKPREKAKTTQARKRQIENNLPPELSKAG